MIRTRQSALTPIYNLLNAIPTVKCLFKAIYSCNLSVPRRAPFPTARAFTVRALQILHAKMSGCGQRTSLRSSPLV